MQYYKITRNWAKIKKAINDDNVQHSMVIDFNKFTYGRWGQEFKRGMLPREFETCDWDICRKGRHPEYWNYVKHSACHWLVNFNLQLAKITEPTKSWRIVTSQLHSTVWDGEETLFDFNFTALQVDPNEAFELANEKQLKIGKELKVHFADNVMIKK